MPDLQFTMEEEVEDKLPSLDVLVCRQPNGELATSVYRKPTNTLQILSYNSNHPPQHKRSCVRTLYRRVETQCSTPAAKLNEIKLLRELFRANGYPRAFIERSRRQPKKRNEEHSQPNSWRSIPYIKGVSEVVARSLAPLGIGVAHRPDSTIRRQVMRPKDPIPKQEMSAVVYRLQCSCGSCKYVGETGRRLQTRMHEHKLAVRRLDPKSEVATHAAQMGHIFNFDAVEIVGRGSDHTARQVQEAWMSTDRSVNRHINLPPPYLTLRTFLAGDSHGAGQSGPSVITAADGGDSDDVLQSAESDSGCNQTADRYRGKRTLPVIDWTEFSNGLRVPARLQTVAQAPAPQPASARMSVTHSRARQFQPKPPEDRDVRYRFSCGKNTEAHAVAIECMRDTMQKFLHYLQAEMQSAEMACEEGLRCSERWSEEWEMNRQLILDLNPLRKNQNIPKTP
nr:unnamed protein product [Spirometra erinaceieuropaei]